MKWRGRGSPPGRPIAGPTGETHIRPDQGCPTVDEHPPCILPVVASLAERHDPLRALRSPVTHSHVSADFRRVCATQSRASAPSRPGELFVVAKPAATAAFASRGPAHIHNAEVPVPVGPPGGGIDASPSVLRVHVAATIVDAFRIIIAHLLPPRTEAWATVRQLRMRWPAVASAVFCLGGYAPPGAFCGNNECRGP